MRRLVLAVLLLPTLHAIPASAQAPGISIRESEKPALTEEEKARQEKLDRAYNAAVNQRPDSKVTDPWGNVRAAPQSAAHPQPTAKTQQPPKKLDLSTPK